MKIPTLIIAFCILAINTHCKANDARAVTKQSLYIDNVHIVDINTGNIIKDRQLHIRAGKIIAINPALTPVADQSSLYHNGNGYYLMPGLIDMHVHAYDPAAFTITLSHGVTHLRLMNGVPDHLVWRNELEAGSRIGSTITVSSAIISGFKNARMHALAHTTTDATKAVIKAKQMGYDLIKAYGNLPAPVLDALLNEAKMQNIPVAKHGPHPAVDMEWDALAGLQSLEHVEDIYQGPLNYREDQQQLDAAIIKLKALNIPITPTLNIFWHLTQISAHKQTYIDSLPGNYISPIMALTETRDQVKRWLNSPMEMTEHNKKTLMYLLEITRQLFQAKLTLLVGSDSGTLLSPHGLATHKELVLMQQAGLPNIAVLQAATVNAARALGKDSQLGQIAIGYDADLILSEQNPLENLHTLQQPAAVVKHGRLFSKTELEALRNKAIEERSWWQEIITLLKAG